MSSVNVKEIGPCKQQFSIVVDVEAVQGAWKKNLQEVATTITLPGFRKGKVPHQIVEKRFQKELEDQVKNDLVSEHFEKALKENDFTPLADPAIADVQFNREEGLQFSATVEVRPQFELGNYKGIALTKPKAQVTSDEVDETVNNLRRQQARLEISQEPAKAGDHLTATAEFFVDNQSVHKIEHAHLHVGHDHLHHLHLPELGKKITGSSTGDEITWEVTLDENFPVEEHQGALATIQLVIEEIKFEKLPELDESFFKIFGVEDEKQLRERVEEDLKRAKNQEVEETISEEMLDKIAEPLNISIPEDLLKRQSVNLVRQDQIIYQIAQAPQEEQQKLFEAELEKVKSIAQTQVRNFFILEKIADKEKIFVTEKEMAQHITQLAISRGQPPEKFMEEIRQNEGLAEIRLGLRERKTVKWLLGKADVTEVEAEESHDQNKASKKEKKSSQ